MLGQARQLYPQFFQVQQGYFLVQVFWQHVNFISVFFGILPKLDLRHDLVGERIGHDKTWMPRSTAQVYQASLGEQDNPLAIRENHMVDLGLDVFPLIVAQAGDIDFVVEMTDIADDCLIFHFGHLIVADDVVVAGSGHEYIHLVASVVHRHDAVTFHGRLQRTDWINFGDPHGCAQTPQ